MDLGKPRRTKIVSVETTSQKIWFCEETTLCAYSLLPIFRQAGALLEINQSCIKGTSSCDSYSFSVENHVECHYQLAALVTRI